MRFNCNTFLHVSSSTTSPINRLFVVTAARQRLLFFAATLLLVGRAYLRQDTRAPHQLRHLQMQNCTQNKRGCHPFLLQDKSSCLGPNFTQETWLCSARLQQVTSLVGNRTSKSLLIQRVNTWLHMCVSSRMVEPLQHLSTLIEKLVLNYYNHACRPVKTGPGSTGRTTGIFCRVYTHGIFTPTSSRPRQISWCMGTPLLMPHMSAQRKGQILPNSSR